MYYGPVVIFNFIWCIMAVIDRYLKCTHTEYAILPANGSLGGKQLPHYKKNERAFVEKQ
jgi:hypothetical protein